jgi:hypothetical protein
MIWRKTNPLARQLLQISEVVCHSADALRKQHDRGSRNPRPKRRSGGGYSLKRRASTEAEAISERANGE